MTYECTRCRMTFADERPAKMNGHTTRCAEPGCGVRFGEGCEDDGPVNTWLAGDFRSDNLRLANLRRVDPEDMEI